ncbi:MAG: PD40 domain-containing protein, partial [Gemmatimonadales bacterium]|nr:PD40 domain-containing protein [Gemmatimonadales bacterium]
MPRLARWLPSLLLVLATPVAAQQKPLLTPADYGQFESLGFGTSLSPDGRWLAYLVNRVNEQNELRIRPLDRDTTIVGAFGTAPRFAANSRWLAWTVGVSPEERARLEKDRKPVRTGVAVLNLVTGGRVTHEQVRAHAFDATGQYLALHGYAPEAPSGKGADLRVVHLASGTVMNFGNVGEFSWSDRGSLLAMAIATGTTIGNGIQVHNAATGQLRSLDASSSTYRALAWRKDALDLVALRTEAAAGAAGTRHHLLVWRGADGTPTRLDLNLAAAGVADTLE